MFTVPQFVAYVQTGVYAKGSKFRLGCYDGVCLEHQYVCSGVHREDDQIP